MQPSSSSSSSSVLFLLLSSFSLALACNKALCASDVSKCLIQVCNPKSTEEELRRPIPSLCRALTDGDAPLNMMVVSFPAAEELSYHQNLSFLETLEDTHHNVSLPGNSIHTSYDTQGEERSQPR